MAQFPLKGATATLNVDGAGAVTLAGVVSIDKLGDYRADQMLDITLLADVCVKQLGVMPDYGTVELLIRFDPLDSLHVAAQGAAGNGKTNNTLAITFADTGTTTISFAGPIQSFESSGGGRGSLLEKRLILKINELPTIS